MDVIGVHRRFLHLYPPLAKKSAPSLVVAPVHSCQCTPGLALPCAFPDCVVFQVSFILSPVSLCFVLHLLVDPLINHSPPHSICNTNPDKFFLIFTQPNTSAYCTTLNTIFPLSRLAITSTLLASSMESLRKTFSLNATLSEVDANKRESLFFFCSVGAVVCLLVCPSEILRESYLGAVGAGVGGVVCSVCTILVSCGYQVTNRLAMLTGIGLLIATILTDLHKHALLEEAWPLLVLVIDLMVLLRVQDTVAVAIVATSVLWVAFVSVESWTRFGLFDVPLLSVSQENRYSVIEALVHCETLPCAKDLDVVVVNLLVAVGVLVTNFLTTRTLLLRLQREERAVQSTSQTLDQIADLLGSYDLGGIHGVLEEHRETLPADVRRALRRLECNLAMFLPFIPRACLSSSIGDESDSTQSGSIIVVPMSTEGSLPKPKDVFTFQSLRATLVVINLKAKCFDEGSFVDFFATILSHIIASVETRRGVVDVFVGDKVHCSFGAFHRCTMHASMAVGAVKEFLWGHSDFDSYYLNAGIASGEVSRAVMGCNTMRRCNVVGDLAAVHVVGMERAGFALRIPVLCNLETFAEAECEHSMRMVLRLIELTPKSTVFAAELLHETIEKGDQNWNGTGADSEWHHYNLAVTSYLQGRSAEEVLECAGSKQEEFKAALIAASTTALRLHAEED